MDYACPDNCQNINSSIFERETYVIYIISSFPIEDLIFWQLSGHGEKCFTLVTAGGGGGATHTFPVQKLVMPWVTALD